MSTFLPKGKTLGPESPINRQGFGSIMWPFGLFYCVFFPPKFFMVLFRDVKVHVPKIHSIMFVIFDIL